MESVNMPKLGLQMTCGMITEWYVKEGDFIQKGAPLFGVETDKLASDVESTVSGTVLKILVPEGEEAEVMAPCCYIGDAKEQLEEAAAETAEKNSRVMATPAARALAKERGIDLQNVKGTGPGGRIQKEDILALGEERSLEEKENTESHTEPLSSMRRVIGARLSRSKQEIPHIYMEVEVDASAMVKAREVFGETAVKQNGQKLTYNDMVLKAAALAVAEFPAVNSRLEEGSIRYFHTVNLGMAVNAEQGLFVPVIRDAQKKSVAEISREAAKLAKRAREGKLLPEDMEGGTFTVSNMGNAGIDGFHAVINPPEAGILAVASIREKAVAVDHAVVLRPMVRICGSFDHRLMDGAYAAKFMIRVKELLENALALFY